MSIPACRVHSVAVGRCLCRAGASYPLQRVTHIKVLLTTREVVTIRLVCVSIRSVRERLVKRSSVQRSRGMLPAPSWCFGPFRMDPATTCLWRGDQLVPLPPKPFAVLAYLVMQAGKVVTKDALFEAVWPETAVSEGVLKTCIGQIRLALAETARAPQYIATVHRRGYRFMAPVTMREPSPTAVLTQAPQPFAAGATVSAQSEALPPVPMVAREAELAQLSQRWQQAL